MTSVRCKIVLIFGMQVRLLPIPSVSEQFVDVRIRFRNIETFQVSQMSKILAIVHVYIDSLSLLVT